MRRLGLALSAACAMIASGIPSPAAAAGFAAVKFVSSQVGWVADNGVILATIDGGRTWRQQYQGRTDFTTLDFIDARTGWTTAIDIVHGTGLLLGTTDGGRTWTKLGEPPHPLRSVSFGSATHGWGIAGGTPMSQSVATEVTAPFSGGTLVSTEDGGRTWRARVQPPSIDSVCATSAHEAWLATQAAVIGTQDFGDSWLHLLAAPVDIRFFWFATIRCAGANTAWALFAGNRAEGNHRPYAVLHTLDAGAHWDPVFIDKTTPAYYPKIAAAADGPGNFPGPFCAVDASTAYFLGVCPGCGGVTITGTRDGGRTWSPPSTIPDLTFGPVALSFPDPDHGWVVGNINGRPVIYATGDGGKTWLERHP